MLLATQGQKVVVKDGYIPLPSKVAAKAWHPLNSNFAISKTISLEETGRMPVLIT